MKPFTHETAVLTAPTTRIMMHLICCWGVSSRNRSPANHTSTTCSASPSTSLQLSSLSQVSAAQLFIVTHWIQVPFLTNSMHTRFCFIVSKYIVQMTELWTVFTKFVCGFCEDENPNVWASVYCLCTFFGSQWETIQDNSYSLANISYPVFGGNSMWPYFSTCVFSILVIARNCLNKQFGEPNRKIKCNVEFEEIYVVSYKYQCGPFHIKRSIGQRGHHLGVDTMFHSLFWLGRDLHCIFM